METLLGKLEEKLRTIIRLRLKIVVSYDLEPEEMERFTQDEGEYLDNNVEDILRDLEEVIETYKLDICSMIQDNIDEDEWYKANGGMENFIT